MHVPDTLIYWGWWRDHVLFAPAKMEWAQQCMCLSLLMKSSSQQGDGIIIFLPLQLWVMVTLVTYIYVHTVLYFIIHVDKFDSTCGWYPKSYFLKAEARNNQVSSRLSGPEVCISLLPAQCDMRISQFDI